MASGPIEYMVIGVRHDRFVAEALQELLALQEQQVVRVLDLLFVEKAADGAVTTREVSELAGNEAYDDLAETLAGLPTGGNVEWLAEEMPPGTTAVVVFFEHVWRANLTEVIHRMGGVLLGGGLVPPAAPMQPAADNGAP